MMTMEGRSALMGGTIVRAGARTAFDPRCFLL